MDEIVPVHAAKTHLSQLLARVEAGGGHHDRSRAETLVACRRSVAFRPVQRLP